MTDKPKCWLDDPKWRQCCCSCVHHKPLYLHEMSVVNWDKDKHNCVCDIQIGWVCVPPYDDAGAQLWKEHSVGCELFEKRDNERQTS